MYGASSLPFGARETTIRRTLWDMIVSLLITVEGSKPEMSRLINVDDSIHLGELANVIEAAFGFSGMATHMYMDSTGPTRNVYVSAPTEGEVAEHTVTVADLGPTTYVYDSGANWNMSIEPLGDSEIDGPTPLLVDAMGPDVVEACGGPAMMTRFHHEARRLTAGLVPDMEIAPLLLSFLPVMSPERILQRLTNADHVTISERIAYVAEELQIDSVSRAPEDPRAPMLADEFDHFLAGRPDLQHIMALDPHPEHNPTLVQAIAEFFSEALIEDEGEDPMEHNLSVILEYVADGVRLDDNGQLSMDDVCAIASSIGFGGTRCEEHAGPVRALRQVLTIAGVIQEKAHEVRLSPLGQALIDDTPALVDHLAEELPQAFSRSEWPQVLMWLTASSGAQSLLGPTTPLPADVERAANVFVGLGVLEPSNGLTMTGAGQRFLAQLLERHADEI
ncbi:plasmid pRiA4b ORF-3 family protein [Corynebacterium cystitidis]|uniref:plasmid pRiA4b ORF-3 family protein n=2 Tax=Corynebacterium cystitidis TaxID=35757 RepID=UPI00211E6C33|nr:plasmid pRiA4b ORF-3 family protein [Corynebacterium cystitidis]